MKHARTIQHIQLVASPLMRGRGLKPLLEASRYKGAWSPLMRGRGLKPRKPKFAIRLAGSPLMRGRGLKRCT